MLSVNRYRVKEVFVSKGEVTEIYCMSDWLNEVLYEWVYGLSKFINSFNYYKVD